MIKIIQLSMVSQVIGIISHILSLEHIYFYISLQASYDNTQMHACTQNTDFTLKWTCAYMCQLVRNVHSNKNKQTKNK